MPAAAHDGKGWMIANEGEVHGTSENVAEEDLSLASMGNLEGALQLFDGMFPACWLYSVRTRRSRGGRGREGITGGKHV